LQDTQVVSRVRAPGGTLQVDQLNRQILLLLTNAWGVYLNTNAAAGDEADKWIPFIMQEWPLQVDFRPLSAGARKPSYSNMTFRDLWQEKRMLEQQGVDATPVYVQLHRQVAFSFACIGFTLVGIPLGLRAHRRETSVGIALAVLLVLVYYSFIILGESLQTRAELAPHLIVWLPNFIFQALGAVLLWRANRGV